MDRLMMVSPKLTELTASLNKTKKVLGVKGLKYPSKEKCSPSVSWSQRFYYEKC
jgi:hypothetical protein